MTINQRRLLCFYAIIKYQKAACTLFFKVQAAFQVFINRRNV